MIDMWIEFLRITFLIVVGGFLSAVAVAFWVGVACAIVDSIGSPKYSDSADPTSEEFWRNQ